MLGSMELVMVLLVLIVIIIVVESSDAVRFVTVMIYTTCDM